MSKPTGPDVTRANTDLVWQVGQIGRRMGMMLRLYGPSDRSAAQGRLRRRALTEPVTRPCRLPASGPIDNYPGEILPH
jgi:hypothetical protein